MEVLIRLSLALNIVVLVPVCAGIFRRSDWVAEAYGPASPALGILLSVYAAILVASVGLFIKPVPAMVAALLAIQIIYKLSTPFTVQSFSNPVVLSNLAIAAFHAVTLFVLARNAGT